MDGWVDKNSKERNMHVIRRIYSKCKLLFCERQGVRRTVISVKESQLEISGRADN